MDDHAGVKLGNSFICKIGHLQPTEIAGTRSKLHQRRENGVNHIDCNFLFMKSFRKRQRSRGTRIKCHDGEPSIARE
jgi:hypothetical protein